MTIGTVTALADMTEKEWDAQLFAAKTGLAPMLGWTLSYHTLRSKGSASGFPDRVLARERVIYVETKSTSGRLSEAQRRWLDGLAKAGAEAYVWYPSDLDEVARVLGKRWSYSMISRALVSSDLLTVLEPGSMWIPGAGRRDGR